MNKLGNIFMLLSFLLFIFGFGAYLVFSEDRATSSWENRSLAQKPSLSFEGIADGSYMSAYEKYVTDQFPIRDGWLKANVLMEKYTNQTFVNNFFITDTNYVIKEGLEYFAQDNMKVSVSQMNQLGEHLKNANKEMYFFYLPARVVALKEIYPEYIKLGYTEQSKDYVFDQITNENVQKYDLTQEWLDQFTIDERKQLFYQTDHHWNANGALEGYKFIRNTLAEQSKKVNVEPFKDQDYAQVCSKQAEFIGSYNLQLYNTVNHEDQPCHNVSKIYNYDEDYNVVIGAQNSGANVKASNIYGSKMYNTQGLINYADVFMQDMAEINITNLKKVEAGEIARALIIKDSFANAVNMLVAENFAHTSILDLRYFQAQTVEQYIEQNNIDVVIVLYNGETIFKSMYNFDGSVTN